jgi:hypothetical protein
MALLTVLVLAGSALAGNAIAPGKLDVDPPTLIGLGFQWWLSGDENRNATLEVDYRQQGQADWRPAPTPHYSDGSVKRNDYAKFESLNLQPHFAGSVIDLQADRAYEVRLTLKDPDGVKGESVRTFTARTRREPEPFAGGRTLEAYPAGQNKPTLPDILDTLQPGDTVRLHAGVYSPPAITGPCVESRESAAPSRKTEGEVRHVYPPGYKGPKEQPHFETFNHAYHGHDWNADFMFQILPLAAQPGDTIVLHAGTYKANRFHYRDKIGLWQHGTYYLTRKATADKPITIKAAGDGEVILDGADSYQLINAEGATHHILQGLTLRNSFIGVFAGTGRKASAKGIEIRNCVIDGVRYGVIGPEKQVQVYGTKISAGAYEDRYEGTYEITAKGTAEKPISFVPAGDGEVIFDGNDNYCLFDVMASEHLLFKGLTFRNTFLAFDAGRLEHMGALGLTVKQCRMENVQNGILGLDGDCRDFTILDNVMIGRLPRDEFGFGQGHHSGYAVNLCGAGHSVGYNYAEGFWDIFNVSTSSTSIPGQRSYSMDFYNNDLRRGADNIFEIDGTLWNIRFMRNRCAAAGSFAFSSQKTLVGPSYCIRNILAYTKRNVFKCTGGSSGFYNFHNTTFNSCGLAGEPLNIFCISKDQGRDHGSNLRPRPEYFANLPEQFFSLEWPDILKLDPAKLDFSLAPDSAAVDAGVAIRGINNNFTGKAPDIGALERGRPLPHYGPRTQKTKR